jgi:hypothetical protein
MKPSWLMDYLFDDNFSSPFCFFFQNKNINKQLKNQNTERADSHRYLLLRSTFGKVSLLPTLRDKFLLYLFLYLYISLLGYSLFWRSVHQKFCSVICGANTLPYQV